MLTKLEGGIVSILWWLVSITFDLEGIWASREENIAIWATRYEKRFVQVLDIKELIKNMYVWDSRFKCRVLMCLTQGIMQKNLKWKICSWSIKHAKMS